MLSKQVVGVIFLVLAVANSTFAQDQQQLNLKKIELLSYVKEKVRPQLDQAIKASEDSARTRWMIFGGGALTVGGFIIAQHQRVLNALNQKINTLLADQERLNLQIAQQRSNATNITNEMTIARTQSRSGVVLEGVFNAEGVTVPPHGQLDELTNQLSHLDEASLDQWWDLLRQRRAAQLQVDLHTSVGRAVSTTELDSVIEKIARLEDELFSNGQREIALEIRKIKVDSQRLQQLLINAEANLKEANLRVTAISDNVGQIRSRINGHNTRYVRIGAVAMVGLTALGFAANMYWVNERYKDYFGQTLSAQKLASSSSYTLKQNTIYLMAKKHIIGTRYEDCPDQDYAWVNESLRDEEEIEHVQAWIDAMQAVCLQLSLMDEEACRTSDS